MDPRLPFVDRIERLLEAELGHRVDRARLLTDAVYARDVLLACDALRATEGPALAAAFRQALLPPPPAADPAPQRTRPAQAYTWPAGGDTSGFGYTQPPQPEAPPAPDAPRLRFTRRPWFSASRWLDR